METRHDRYEMYKNIMNKNDNGGDICVLFYNQERTLYNRSRRANWHENLEIQLCHSGEGYVILNGEKTPIASGDIVVANSNVIHYNGTDTSIIYSALIIDNAFCRKAGIDYTCLEFQPLIKSESLQKLFGEVIKAYYTEEPLCKVARLQLALLALLIELRERHTVAEGASDRETSTFSCVKLAIQYIRENYDKKITLDDIAQSVLADKYNLSRSFKALTGQTIVQYINNYRCEKAKALISRGVSVNEAAVTCGFNNMSFFTKTFRHYTGRLPSEYKHRSE